MLLLFKLVQRLESLQLNRTTRQADGNTVGR
jgi:hypothetical protein